MSDTKDADEVNVPSLQSLRQEGAHHFDPARFHYLEALAQRMQQQPAAVQQVLAGKLQKGLVDYADRWSQAPTPRASKPKTACTLAELNRYIKDRTQHGSAPAFAAGNKPTAEMKSVQRFGEVWAKIAAEAQVKQAVGRGPENAGPLNSHMLMLRSLKLMRELSPDYLRRFMSQVDALLWLDQINQQCALPDAKSARRGGRAKK